MPPLKRWCGRCFQSRSSTTQASRRVWVCRPQQAPCRKTPSTCLLRIRPVHTSQILFCAGCGVPFYTRGPRVPDPKRFCVQKRQPNTRKDAWHCLMPWSKASMARRVWEGRSSRLLLQRSCAAVSRCPPQCVQYSYIAVSATACHERT